MGNDEYRIVVKVTKNKETQTLMFYYQTFLEQEIAGQVISKGLHIDNEVYVERYSNGEWRFYGTF